MPNKTLKMLLNISSNIVHIIRLSVNFKVRILLILLAHVINKHLYKFRVLSRDALTFQNIRYLDKLTI